MSDRKVVPFVKGGAEDSVDTLTDLTRSIAQSFQAFEEQHGHPPTGMAVVLVDDDGRYRVGWNLINSALPGGAVIGLALAALTKAVAE